MNNLKIKTKQKSYVQHNTINTSVIQSECFRERVCVQVGVGQSVKGRCLEFCMSVGWGGSEERDECRSGDRVCESEEGHSRDSLKVGEVR